MMRPSILALAFILVSAGVAAQINIPLPFGQSGAAQQVVDLGKREAGKSYPLNLEAQNRNCEQPLDFRFAVKGAKWLRLSSGRMVRGVTAGQKKSLPSMLDFANVRPGRHTAQVEVTCENCGGFLIFANCRIDKEIIQFKVEVTAAQASQQDAAQAAQQQAVAVDAAMTYGQPQQIDAATEAQLDDGQRRQLEAARRKYRTAVAAAADAERRLEAAREKKKDCEDELAALKKAADHAAADAAAAQVAADAAEAAAKAAEQHLADYGKELAEAEKAMDQAYKVLQAQAAYRSIVRGEDGTGSERYREADKSVDKANDAALAAQKHYLAVKGSLAARKAAAEKARAEANAKKAEADKAAAKAAEAKAAYEKKLRECGLLGEQEAGSEQDKAKADAAAKNAAAAQQAAEDKARDEAEKNRQKALQAAEARHHALVQSKHHEAHVQTQAFKALKTLGVFSGAKDRDLNIEKMVAEWFVTTATECVAEYLKLQTFEVFTALDALQAAYGLANIRQQQLIPLRGAYLGDDYLAGWLQRHDYAKDSKEAMEIVKTMTRVMEHGGNLGFLKQEWEERIRKCCEAAVEAEKLKAGQ